MVKPGMELGRFIYGICIPYQLYYSIDLPFPQCAACTSKTPRNQSV